MAEVLGGRSLLKSENFGKIAPTQDHMGAQLLYDRAYVTKTGGFGDPTKQPVPEMTITGLVQLRYLRPRPPALWTQSNKRGAIDDPVARSG